MARRASPSVLEFVTRAARRDLAVHTTDIMVVRKAKAQDLANFEII